MPFLGGMLTTMCDEVRQMLDEPSQSSKLSNVNVLLRAQDGWSAVNRELQALSQKPLIGTIDYTPSTTGSLNGYITDVFQLPVLCTAVRKVYFLDVDSICIGDVKRVRLYDSYDSNVGYQVQGHQLSLRRPDNGPEATVRVEYEAGGFMPLHYGTLASAARTSSTVKLSAATSVVGSQDYRPNAYVGGYWRLISTTTPPTGYAGITNIGLERRIIGWAETTHTSTLVAPVLPFTDGGDWSYEVVPTLDWSLWRGVSLWTARFIANAWGRRAQAQGLTIEYTAYMRAIRLTEASTDAAQKDAFEDDYYRQHRRRIMGRLRRR